MGRGLHRDGHAVPHGEPDRGTHVGGVGRADHDSRAEGADQVVRGALLLVPFGSRLQDGTAHGLTQVRQVLRPEIDTRHVDHNLTAHVRSAPSAVRVRTRGTHRNRDTP